MAEPAKASDVVKTGDPGRPAYSDEFYHGLLSDMRAFLETGCSLWHAIQKSGHEMHMATIYEKYRLKDWFSQKIDAWRLGPGELANNLVFRMMQSAEKKLKLEQPVTQEEWKAIQLTAEKHRSAQPFFVTRVETAPANKEDLGRILDTLDKSNYDEFGPTAEKQAVANDAPVQDQNKAGADNNVPAQRPATETPTGTA